MFFSVFSRRFAGYAVRTGATRKGRRTRRAAGSLYDPWERPHLPIPKGPQEGPEAAPSPVLQEARSRPAGQRRPPGGGHHGVRGERHFVDPGHPFAIRLHLRRLRRFQFLHHPVRDQPDRGPGIRHLMANPLRRGGATRNRSASRIGGGKAPSIRYSPGPGPC